MNTAQIIPFDFEKHPVRAVTIEGEPWFVASDICKALSVANTTQALQSLDGDERSMLNIGRQGEANIVNESGLFTLILRSRDATKPGTPQHRFRKWVTAEVLPAIRKHGRYEDSEDKISTLIGQTIGTDGFHCLGAVLDGKVRQLPVKTRQRAKMHVWSQVHKAFSVVSAQDIPANQLDSARNFIAAYTLEGEWLGKEEAKDGVFMKSDHLYLVYFVCHHFNSLNKIFNKYGMYKNLEGLGSRAGIEMIGHFEDGGHAAHTLLKTYAQPMDDHQRTRGMNQYRRSA